MTMEDSILGWGILLAGAIAGGWLGMKAVIAEYEEYLYKRRTGWQ